MIDNSAKIDQAYGRSTICEPTNDADGASCHVFAAMFVEPYLDLPQTDSAEDLKGLFLAHRIHGEEDA